MKGWLARAAANSVRRGRRAVALRWAHWFPRSAAVEPARFQGRDEAYPGHWRRPPTPWSAGVAAPSQLPPALAALPDLWRAVVWARDGEHRRPGEVAEEFGLTLEQEQQVLNQARAALCEQLASRGADRGRR